MFFFQKNPMIVRGIRSAKNEIYLTFDDGPSQELTPQILDLLNEFGAKASFFVIGEEAHKRPEIIKRIVQEDHGLFTHSREHAYSNYFRSTAILKTWIEKSLLDLRQHTGLVQNAFRPPAGVLTPPLIKAAEQLNCPLVLWNHRFFDTTLGFTKGKAEASIRSLNAGDIVLLHDRQPIGHRQELFLKTLRKYLQDIHRRGYRCACLSDSILQREVQHASHTINDSHL